MSATFDLGSTTNLFKNTYTQTVLFATGSANSTQYTGTANNANNLNGQPASFYANATNITAGTLATARLPATVNVTTLNATTVNTVNIVANGSTGTLGQVLSANGSGIYWASPAPSGVTSVASGNGLSGGPITSTGTLVVAQGNGIVVNTSGVHVNSSFIAGSTANNSTNLGNQPASFYTNASNITTGTLATARLPATINTTSINVNTVSISNTLTVGANSTFNALMRSSSIIPIGNTLHALGNSSNYFEIAYIAAIDLGGAQLTVGEYTGTANNANNLDGQDPSFYTNATNLATGTVPVARLPAGSTTVAGIVRLNDTVTSTSTTLAATANSVRAVQAYAETVAATGTPPSGVNTNIQFNNSGVFGGSAAFTFNNTTNTVTVGSQLSVGANASLSTDFLRIGNATVNTAISAGSLTFNGVNVNTAITGNAATAYTNAITIAANATNITTGTLATARLPATVNVATEFNVGANVNANTTAIGVGNATVNLITTSSSLRLSSLTNTSVINTTGFFFNDTRVGSNADLITGGILSTARLPATINTATIFAQALNIEPGGSGIDLGNNSTSNVVITTTGSIGQIRLGGRRDSAAVMATGNTANVIVQGGVVTFQGANIAFTAGGVRIFNEPYTFDGGDTTHGVRTVLEVGNGSSNSGATYRSNKVDLGANASVNNSINCSVSNYFTATVNSNVTFAFSRLPPSDKAFGLTLEITHSSGSITWPSSVRWPSNSAPLLTTGRTHLFMFVTDDGGARWRGSALVDYEN